MKALIIYLSTRIENFASFFDVLFGVALIAIAYLVFVYLFVDSRNPKIPPAIAKFIGYALLFWGLKECMPTKKEIKLLKKEFKIEKSSE